MMNCNQCKNRIIEYIEGGLSETLDKEMEQHISQCEDCREYYEEELMMDRAFNDVFQIDGIEFNSSRSAIMSSIDKDKYKNTGSKFVSGKNGHKKIIAIAAVFFFLGVLTPVAYNYFGGGINKNTTAMDMKQAAGAAEKQGAQMESADSGLGISSTLVEPEASFKGEGIDNYENSTVPIETKLEFNSTWKTFGSLEATIEGKGNNAQEEGVGTIYVRDKEKSIMYKYTIKVDGTQKSPLSISWYDEDSLIVINGLSHGTLINGEEVQLIDIFSGEEHLIYRAQDKKERIKSVVREGNQLVYTKAIYDDSMNAYSEKIVSEVISD